MPRAVTAILVVLAAALLVPTSVMAAKAQRSTDSSLNLFCPVLRSDAGTVSLSGWIGDRGGTYLEFGFWPTQVEPWESQPTLVGYSMSTLLDDTSVEVTFDVYSTDDTGEGEEEPVDPSSVGQATLVASFQPTGEAETFVDHLRDGNQQYRSSGSWERLAVSGSLVLPDNRTFDLSGCDASNFAQSTFVNVPSVSTAHSKSVMVICNWSTDAGYVTFSAGDSPNAETGVWLWIEGGDGFFYGNGTGSISTSALEASVEMFSASEETETPIGRATASAILTSGDRISATNTFGDSRYSVKGVWLIPDGSLTLELPVGSTTTLTMDEEHCTGSSFHQSKVPARTEHANPVANDTPDAAVPLKLFDNVSVSTAGTVETPEAICLLDDGEGTFEGPLTNTVWWRIEGTGSAITVDTAGSTFDTMVAVYLVEGDKVGPQVGCVDDVDESLQARITFETVADASYLVQTGGFGGETGDLNVSVYE